MLEILFRLHFGWRHHLTTNQSQWKINCEKTKCPSEFDPWQMALQFNHRWLIVVTSSSEWKQTSHHIPALLPRQCERKKSHLITRITHLPESSGCHCMCTGALWSNRTEINSTTIIHQTSSLVNASVFARWKEKRGKNRMLDQQNSTRNIKMQLNKHESFNDSASVDSATVSTQSVPFKMHHFSSSLVRPMNWFSRRKKKRKSMHLHNSIVNIGAFIVQAEKKIRKQTNNLHVFLDEMKRH